MCIVDDQHLIQAFLTHGSDPTLGKGIRIGGMIRDKQDRSSFGLEDGIEGRGELAISVMDQETHRALFII